jgi:hypothetical protein
VTPAQCPGSIACDLTRETLAAEALELRDRVRSLEADVDAYRAIAVEAIAAVRALTLQRRRLCDRLRALVDELRTLRDSGRRVA